MKLTKSQLKQIIKEELEKILQENGCETDAECSGNQICVKNICSEQRDQLGGDPHEPLPAGPSGAE
jgi:hypothetical protein